MIIKLKIKAHIYIEEQIHDEFFDNGGKGCVLPKEIINAVGATRECNLDYNYGPNTSFDDVCNEIYSFYGLEDFKQDNSIFFYNGDVRYIGSECSLRFDHAVRDFLDPECNGFVNVDLMLNADAGEYARIENLRYFMYSNEPANEPAHVHIRDTGHNFEVKVFLENFEEILLSGKVTNKDKKKYQNFIKEKKDDMFGFWNTKTTGMKVDINHYYHFKE